MYGFAVEDCLYHPTCEKRFSRRFGKHRESENVSPYKLCLQKIAFELWLDFENLEIYTLQALWECYTDLLHAMGKHLGHNKQSNVKCQGHYSLFHNSIYVNRYEFSP